MVRTTLIVAVILVLLGAGFYLGTGRESVTALIPAFVGIALGICGLLGRREKWRKHAMHAAVVLGVLGVAGGAPGIPSALEHLAGEAIERPAAAWGRAILALICLAFVVLGVRSFIQARRAR